MSIGKVNKNIEAGKKALRRPIGLTENEYWFERTDVSSKLDSWGAFFDRNYKCDQTKGGWEEMPISISSHPPATFYGQLLTG